MPDIHPIFKETRPAILLRAARLAQRGYNRKRMLARWLLCGPDLDSGAALADFATMEAEANDLRLSGSFDYKITDHIELLAGVLYEAARANSDQPKASGSEAFRSAI